MTNYTVAGRLDDAVLAEQWYSFIHKLISQLQHAFRASKLTQKSIADRLGKRPEVVSRCLAGQKNMTIRTMHDLARAMDCRLEIVVRPLSEVTPTNRGAVLGAGQKKAAIEPTGSEKSSIYEVPNEIIKKVLESV